MTIKEIAIKIAGTVVLYILYRVVLIISKHHHQGFKQRLEKANPKLITKASWFLSDNSKIHWTIGFVVMVVFGWLKDLGNTF